LSFGETKYKRSPHAKAPFIFIHAASVAAMQEQMRIPYRLSRPSAPISDFRLTFARYLRVSRSKIAFREGPSTVSIVLQDAVCS